MFSREGKFKKLEEEIRAAKINSPIGEQANLAAAKVAEGYLNRRGGVPNWISTRAEGTSLEGVFADAQRLRDAKKTARRANRGK